MTDLTCCQLINAAQGDLARIEFNPPQNLNNQVSDYLKIANQARECAQDSLKQLSKKTCEPDCCELAASTIVIITRELFSILACLACLNLTSIQLNEFSKFYLDLFKKLLNQIVCASECPKTCCVESRRAEAIMSGESLIVSDRVFAADRLSTYLKLFRIIQRGFDDLLKTKLTFACCSEAGAALISLQSNFIELILQTSSDTFIKAFAGGLSNPTGIAIRGDLAYVTDTGTNDIQVFNIVTGANIGSFGGGDLNDPRGIAICQNRAYVADSGLSLVLVFDLNTQTLVDQIGEGILTVVRGPIAAKGGRIYVPVNNVLVFDVNTGQPIDTIPIRSDNGIFIQGSFLYMLNSNFIRIYDLNIGEQVRELFVQGTGDKTGLVVKGSLAYVTSSNGNVQVYDLNSDTDEIFPIYVFGENELSGPRALAIQGDRVYVADDDEDNIFEYQLNFVADPEIELCLLSEIIQQLTQKCQVQNECCLGKLFADLYFEYIDASLIQFRTQEEKFAFFRKFTSLVYQKLEKLQKTEIQQTECCEESFASILAAYESARDKFIQIFDLENLDLEKQIVPVGATGLDQIRNIIRVLLSNKCLPISE